MRRFLSIVICSVALASGGAAQTVEFIRWNSGTSETRIRITIPTAEQLGHWQVNLQSAAYQNVFFISNSGTFPRIVNFQVSGNPALFGAAGQLGVNQVFGALRRWNTATGTPLSEWSGNLNEAPEETGTVNFSWTFGPEWAGTILQVRATNGTSLGTWGLPSVIGSNYVLSSSIVTNQSLLTGAQVFLDGVPAAVLATAGTNSNLDAFADRPGYALSFGGDYQGGEWQIRRSDGSVAGTGSAATLGTVTSGRVTLLPEGSTGSIWTRVPAGDGMGAVWINSGISVSGNNVTTYNFAAAPAPTPLPTPAFQTNAPAPTITNAPAPTTPGTNTTTPAPVATNDVTVDVDELEAIPTDDGEEAALDGVRSASEKLRGILANFRGSFENVALTFNEFRKFTLGGVGTTCTFTLGDVTINLSNIVPAWLRSGMKLAILIVAVFSMIRYTWDTFS